MGEGLVQTNVSLIVVMCIKCQKRVNRYLLVTREKEISSKVLFCSTNNLKQFTIYVKDLVLGKEQTVIDCKTEINFHLIN